MYHPKISDENIRRLYQLKVKRKKPITRVLDEILNEYFSFHQEKPDGGVKKMAKDALS